MKVDGAQEILAAVGHSCCGTLSEMEAYVEKYKRTKKSWEREGVVLCRKAIPYMKKINGVNYLRSW